MLISIIIPVYNREHTIERCIESIISSNEKNLEIIIVDDGSTDNSWSVIESYVSKDSRIKAIHTDNKGVSAARNRGLEIATGEYIHFVDSDDYITCDIYDKCRKVIEEFKPDIIEFNYRVQFEGQNETYSVEMNKIPKGELLDRKFIVEKILPVMVNLNQEKEYFINNFTPMKLFKGSIIRENRVLFDESRRRWEDRIYQVLFLKYANSFYSMDELGYFYVMGNSPSSNYDATQLKLILQGSKPYQRIVGDMYDFEISYCYSYYCKLFNDTVINLFDSIGFNEKTFKNDLKKVLTEENAKKLFYNFEPENKFEENVKKAVLDNDIQKLFKIYKNIVIKKRICKEILNIMNLLKRAYSKLKRTLKNKVRINYFNVYKEK